MASESKDREDFSIPDLERSLRKPRTFISVFLSGFTSLVTIAAMFPLFSVLYMLIVRGGQRLSREALTSLPPAGLDGGGGFGNAIIGTLVMVGIAAAISVPFGILAAIFLAELGPEFKTTSKNKFAQRWAAFVSKSASTVRFSAKVLTGFPSILAGVFAYTAVVLLTGGFSAVAGGIALSILMLPTVMLTAEEAISMVPSKMREAAIGMGATQTQTTWKVLLPTAMPGILTGVMLAVARAAGETAPLLFTALFSNRWITDSGEVDLMQPTASLAVFIYNFSSSPFDNLVELAWAASLVLVLLVLTINIIGQSFSKRVDTR
ncbi:MAG: phosphate ABC transporter permease PstA [Pirellulales bacterium]|nr:phosphate ABC transporter permease PstA [Pirellulales bacterium]